MEFFQKEGSSRFPDAHADITATCIIYLRRILRFSLIYQEFQPDALRRNALLEYSANEIHHHAYLVPVEPGHVHQMFIRFLLDPETGAAFHLIQREFIRWEYGGVADGGGR